MTGKQVVVVSWRQILAAQALIKISGGPDHVEPWVVRVASAGPNLLDPVGVAS